MSIRLLRIAPFAAALAVAAFSVPAQAGVSWSVGINAPIAPGVVVGTVIGGGHAPRYYAPAPVVYAPPPVYVRPPVVYAPPPVYAPPIYAEPVVYGPPPVIMAPRPVYRYYRPPVIVRPGYGYYPHHDWDHHDHDHDHDRDHGRPGPGRGGYEPMNQVHTNRVVR
jgi:hypothetical protein